MVLAKVDRINSLFMLDSYELHKSTLKFCSNRKIALLKSCGSPRILQLQLLCGKPLGKP